MNEELVCRNCGVIQMVSEAKVTATKTKDGRLQIRAECSDCGKWIKWITQTEEILSMLGIEKPKNEFDLDFDTPSIKDEVKPAVEDSDDCTMDFGTSDIRDIPLSNDDCPFDY